jgi:hypothetical protein
MADAVWAVHMAVTAFFLVAWALPWQWALWASIAGAATLHTQWKLNDGLCVLTKLERQLRGLPVIPDRDEGEGDFIAGLLARLAGRPLPPACSGRIAYAVLWGGASLAALRLLLGMERG